MCACDGLFSRFTASVCEGMRDRACVCVWEGVSESLRGILKVYLTGWCSCWFYGGPLGSDLAPPCRSDGHRPAGTSPGSKYVPMSVTNSLDRGLWLPFTLFSEIIFTYLRCIARIKICVLSRGSTVKKDRKQTCTYYYCYYNLGLLLVSTILTAFLIHKPYNVTTQIQLNRVGNTKPRTA